VVWLIEGCTATFSIVDIMLRVYLRTVQRLDSQAGPRLSLGCNDQHCMLCGCWKSGGACEQMCIPRCTC
jgi:hypothetical protein